MKPEDVDKLFKERLGPSSPTPPADLWNRLQDRMADEMPAKEEERRKAGGFMWLSYSIAAAITLLLAVGVVFYSVQRGTVPVDGMARNNELVPEQPLIITKPAPDKTVAEVAAPVATPEEAAIPETTAPAAVKQDALPRATIARTETKAAASRPASKAAAAKVERAVVAPSRPMLAQVEKPAIPDAPKKGDYYNTGEPVPATFASASSANLNAQPVEIIIKRAVAIQDMEEEEEPNGFEKKQKLAKNIFKQVRNLSNGERVELSELGINADKIALETQIGKQKISKVINL